MTLAALAVTCAATGAVAADPDDGPTAEVVPGLGVSYVDPFESHDVYAGWWTGGGAILVPRSATTLDLVIPDEIAALPFPSADVTIDAVSAPGPIPSVRVGAWSDDFSNGALTFEVQDALAAAATAGVTDVVRFEIAVSALEADVDLDLRIDVLLVDGAAGPAQVTLPVPPVKEHTQSFVASTARVAPGGRVTVVAWPGFFGPDAPRPVKAFHLLVGLASWAEVAGEITISADGSTLTMPVAPNFDDPGSVGQIRLGDETTPERRVVGLEFVRATTDAVAAYVTSVYNDLFGREPDPTGLAGWSDALTRGTPYSAVADSITASDEFRMGLITDAYARYLDRLPDPEGLAGWLRAMNRGLHIQQMEAGFLASQEYFDVWGGGTNAGWIRALYLDVLNREASPGEVQAWLPAIARDGREQVSRGFLYSTEKLATDVDGYYQWLLRRPLDDVGRVGWVRAIQNGVRVEVIIAGIIASDEYRGNVPVG